jgi:hypothetical protein
LDRLQSAPVNTGRSAQYSSIVESCDAGVPGSAVAQFEVFVSSVGAPDRYDIGLFVALDGGSARDGDACLHDYLEPPLSTTPTYGDKNGDGVPDIDGGPWLTTLPSAPAGTTSLVALLAGAGSLLLRRRGIGPTSGER